MVCTNSVAGIYIHIPFCKQACHYCNFYFTLSQNRRNDFIRALQSEIELAAEYLKSDEVRTLYFGGGTPSLLSAEDWETMMQALCRHYRLHGLVEFTVEANPDDLTNDKLKLFEGLSSRYGLNRFSVGVQSFSDADLKYMNRAHSSADARHAIEGVKAAGFTNYSVDLIYGTPTMSDEQWRKNLQTCFGFEVPHLSCYALTVEPKTTLERNIRNKKAMPVDEETTARHFEIMLHEMERHGYVQYEISNFCRPGYEAVHNSNYWRYEKYLGLGPSAHSFDGTNRRWNVRNLSNYITALQQGSLCFEAEHLTVEQQFNEYVYMSLRTSQGCLFDFVENRFGSRWTQHLKTQIGRVDATLLDVSDSGIRLTGAGKLLADHIVLQLMADC